MEESQNLIVKKALDSETVMSLISSFKNEYEKDTRLHRIQELAELKFDSNQAYESLKELITSELNDEIRYNLIKILYNNYPEKCISFLTQVLITDYNYNFRIIDFSEDKRYNMNDTLNFIIIKKYHRKKMVKDIISNNLLRFAISWKDYTKDFLIFYDLSLKCFILYNKFVDFFMYFCSRVRDPFDFAPVQKNIIISNIKHGSSIPMNILSESIKVLKEFLKIQEKDLNLAIIEIDSNENLPQFKVFSDNHEFVVYFNNV